jgi:hypothetical protein
MSIEFGANVVSPLRKAPDPHHPDQTVMFESPIETTFASGGRGAELHLRIGLHREPRQKCSSCGKRRVCFYVGIGDIFKGAIMCAKCMGIR